MEAIIAALQRINYIQEKALVMHAYNLDQKDGHTVKQFQ